MRPTRTVISGRRLQLVLPTPVFSDDLVTVSGRNLRARDRRRVRQFGLTAQNRSTPGCTLDTEGPLDPATALVQRRYAILSVHADFADAPGGRLPPFAPIRLGGIDTWLRDLSYGRALVDGTERAETVHMPKNLVDYAHSGAWGGRKAFFQDLVLALDANVDFSRYEVVLVTFARRFGVVTAIEPIAIAPPGQGVVADGKELRHFGAFVFDSPADGLASLLRLAGLRLSSPDFVGVWRAALGLGFQRPLGLLGWDRRKLGWLDPTQVRCLGSTPLEVTLAPLALSGGVKLVLARLSGTALLVLENRQRVGLDATQCKSGILAYEVRPAASFRLQVFPAETRTTTPECRNFAFATYDLPRGGSAAAAGVTFEALDVVEGGAYRLRVRR